jgi:hypothetical protein
LCGVGRHNHTCLKGVQFLSCPNCGAQIARHQTICPRCDHILDDTLEISSPSVVAAQLGAGLTSGVGKDVRRDTPIDAVPRPGIPRSTPTRPENLIRVASRSSADAATELVRSDEVDARLAQMERAATKRTPEPRPPTPRSREHSTPRPHSSPPRVRAPSSHIVQPGEALDEAKELFRDVGFSDRVALGGAGAAILTCFLPWKDTALGGEIIGFVSLGFALFLACVVGIGAITVRARHLSPRMTPVTPWLVQLGASCFCVLWCLVFIKLSWNATRVPSAGFGLEVPLSRPVYGVYLALVASSVYLAGTLLGLRDKAH